MSSSLNNDWAFKLGKLFPALEPWADGLVLCPAHQSYHADLFWTIICLNDQHHWDRERIADWLEESGLNLELKND